jgi:chromosome segregation ATPase
MPLLAPCLQLKVSEQQERLTTLQLSEAETRRQLDIALAELSATRNSAAGAESAASEAAGLRRALAEAERQMNGAGAELSELSRQLAEAKGQRDASQVSGEES